MDDKSTYEMEVGVQAMLFRQLHGCHHDYHSEAEINARNGFQSGCGQNCLRWAWKAEILFAPWLWCGYWRLADCPLRRTWRESPNGERRLQHQESPFWRYVSGGQERGTRTLFPTRPSLRHSCIWNLNSHAAHNGTLRVAAIWGSPKGHTFLTYIIHTFVPTSVFPVDEGLIISRQQVFINFYHNTTL